MISMARLLAISPAACPPMPSATIADGQVGEDLDVDRVFVVLAVVAEQAALADVECERHVADPPALKPAQTRLEPPERNGES